MNRITFFVNRVKFFISHSQTTKTFQPNFLSLNRIFLSLAWFASNLGFQKLRRDFGSLVFGHPLCLCQKQPCTKIIFRLLGNTISGRPGSLPKCNRYRYPKECTKHLTATSGLVSLHLTNAILTLRSARVSVSIHPQCYQDFHARQ
jgi:hypothetical protein